MFLKSDHGATQCWVCSAQRALCKKLCFFRRAQSTPWKPSTLKKGERGNHTVMTEPPKHRYLIQHRTEQYQHEKMKMDPRVNCSSTVLCLKNHLRHAKIALRPETQTKNRKMILHVPVHTNNRLAGDATNLQDSELKSTLVYRKSPRRRCDKQDERYEAFP